MPPRPSERALRRLVAELADRPKADVKAVLAALAPSERERVEALFAQLKGAEVAPAEAASVSTDGLSPWLAARVRASARPGQAADFVMTSRAAATLRDVAGAVERVGRASTGKPATNPGSALYDLFTRWLSRPAR